MLLHIFCICENKYVFLPPLICHCGGLHQLMSLCMTLLESQGQILLPDKFLYSLYIVGIDLIIFV